MSKVPQSEKRLEITVFSGQFHQRAAFTHVDPKLTDTVELDSLLMLLGSACVKAARKHVGEIKPTELFTDLSTLNLLMVVWF